MLRYKGLSLKDCQRRTSVGTVEQRSESRECPGALTSPANEAICRSFDRLVGASFWVMTVRGAPSLENLWELNACVIH